MREELKDGAGEVGPVMELPATWELVQFEAAFELVSTNGGKIPASEYLGHGALPVIDQGQKFVGGYTNNLDVAIDPGFGLIVFGDHTRTFKAINFPFAPGADGIKILKPVLTNMKYAFYACSALQFANKGYARHYSHLRKCKVPIAPAREQDRITSKLDEMFSQLDEGERALERVRVLVERYRQSVLKAAVTGELTWEWREQHAGAQESGEALLTRILEARRQAWEKSELAKMTAKGQRPANDQWKKKYKEPEAPSPAEVPMLPDGWVWASLDQMTAKITSGSRDWKDFYDRGDGVFIMAQNVRMRRLDLTDKQFVDPPPDSRDAERSLVAEHDLLLTIVGANTGEVCRVPRLLERHYVCQSVALLRPVDSSTSALLELYLSADEGGQAQFRKAFYGAGRPHLAFDQLQVTGIPLPGPEEQKALIDSVIAAESVIASVEEALVGLISQARTLRQATLRAAFSGQLVSQDPDDEPASVLLERIAAERTAYGSNSRPKAKRAGKKKAKA